MKTRKPKPEASLLVQLSAPLRDFTADFKAHGKSALEQVRTRSPEKYLELSTKLAALVAALKTEPDLFDNTQTHEDIGRKLLQSIGFRDPDDASIEEAIKIQNAFVAQLEAIRNAAESGLN